MSAIYWRDGKHVARLSGAERAHMGVVINGLFVSLFNLDGIRSREEVLRMIPPGHYLHQTSEDRFAYSAALALRVNMDLELVTPDGNRVDAWECALNTALVLGSDPLKLFARLHGQCEIHAYVEGTNRKWLAGIIRDGLSIGLMRDGMGWDAVIALLEASDAGPVVTDYSVCESFPNASAAAYAKDEEFDSLPADEKWRLALAGLRERNKAGCLEMRPNMLGDTFGTRDTALTLLTAWDKVPISKNA